MSCSLVAIPNDYALLGERVDLRVVLNADGRVLGKKTVDKLNISHSVPDVKGGTISTTATLQHQIVQPHGRCNRGLVVHTLATPY